MKKTQFKDASRTVKKQFVSFLSIVVIAALAVVAYLGIVFAGEATHRAAERYYDEHRMWDIQISSTLMLDEEDLAAIRAVEGVEEAEPILQYPANLVRGEQKTLISLFADTGALAAYDLVAGSLPSAAEECLAEESLGLSPGDHVKIQNASLYGIDPVLQKDYVVSGVIHHPDHISKQVEFTPYILVREECFDLEALAGQFAQVRLRVSDAPTQRYGAAYIDRVAQVNEELSALGEQREVLRTEKLRALLEERIADGKAELERGEELLSDGQRRLDEGAEQLRDAEIRLAEASVKLDNGEYQLNDAARRISQGEEQLSELRALLDMIDGYIRKGKDLFVENVPESEWPEDAEISYQEALDLLDQGEEAAIEWLDGASGYTGYLAHLQSAQSEFEKGRNDWYYSGELYLDAITAYKQGLKEYEQGVEEHQKGLAQYEQGRRKLAEAQFALDNFVDCHWLVTDLQSNAGYVFAGNNAQMIESLSVTFSLIFLVIGAIVIYATVERIVQEQSKLVGATKALGLFNREVFDKYMFYGATATVLGVALGVVLAYTVLQRAVLVSQGKFFTFGAPASVFLPAPTLLVALGGSALSVASVWLACSGLLRLPPRELLQGVEAASVRKKAKRAGKGSLYTRLIVLNMLSDSSRVLVTTVSVAGCALLLVVGFALNSGINRVNERQFGPEGVVRFDAELYYDETGDGQTKEQLASLLKEHGLSALCVRKENVIVKPNSALTAAVLICAEPSELGEYYSLRDPDSRQTLTVPEEGGVLAPIRFMESYGFRSGDSFMLYDGDLNLNLIDISGVYDNYFGFPLFFSPETYRDSFGHDAQQNCFLVKLGDMSLQELQALASSVPGFNRVEDAAKERARFDMLSGLVTLVVLAMIVIAALMSFFILLNLSKTYIQKKTRELTIMRINGFTVGESVRFAAWDLILTTLAGTGIGLLLGAWLAPLIIGKVQQPYIQFVKGGDWHVYVYSALITLLFSLLINAIALRRVKKLKLSDLT